MKVVRWGMIGCGSVAEVKSGPALQKANHSQLVAVMRRDAEKAADFARRHKVPRWYAHAEELIADPEVDAVYVATPPSSHMDYTLSAAAAGKPVYVEKPMARTHEECLRMIEACASAGVPLFTAYYRRALPRFLKIKDLIAAGAIGEVRSVQVRLHQPPYPEDRNPERLPWRVKPEIAGGGRFVDLASHTLDFLDFALGPISSARGSSANQGGLYEAEDIVAASFEFESGVLGAGVWCFMASEDTDRTEIAGSKGTISFSTFGEDPVVCVTAEGRQEHSIANPRHIQQPLIQALVHDLNGTGRCPSTGESGARTTRVMDRILQKGSA